MGMQSSQPAIYAVMPKYLPNTRFSDCWSSMGNITFYHRNGQCYYKKKPVYTFPGIPLQLPKVNLHQRALSAWRKLSHEVQLQWNEYAKRVPSKRPPYDPHVCITGHNLFVSAYHGFAQLGHERIPEPQPWKPFPIVTMEYVDAQKSAENLRLRFRLTMSSCSYSRYRLHIKLQLTYPGGGKRPGYMRVFIAEENCKDDGLVTVLIPDYISIWNLDLPEYKAYCRYTLIDTVTGYRNLAQDLVFGINI